MNRLLLSFSALALLGSTASAQTCLTTLFNSNNGGATGWANYMDVTVLNTTTIVSLEANFNSAPGTPVNLEVWTRSGSYVGFEEDPVGWTLVAMGDGTALAAGTDVPTPVPLVASFDFQPGGVTGVAILYVSGGNPYTNGNGANQQYTDGNMTIDLGSSASTPFTPGGSIFSPRVWNGSFCTGMGSSLGTNYCMANTNSTGNAAVISGAGSPVVANNDVTLSVTELPSNSFGFFLTSQTQGLVMNPGGSSGNLCLGGSIGRYVGPGQIQNSGSSGDISLTLTDETPTPTGLVTVAPGETWNFTAWFRDSQGGMATSNFSDGYSIDFQ